ncbi:hypothetical protein FHETE_3727 [Fusarium heterosporum]|uniref:Uncharacterized protein n=1 Tax=Fusarium heterosporum TaxID=42747 RepID=A0A8H5WWB7_FUSHE|nr:hypothetical protein FHETE_3727 [Fusarium heterosporum]
MPGSIKSINRKPTAKSAAKRIGRMFKRTNSEETESTTPSESGFFKDSFEGGRPSISSRYSTSSRMTTREDADFPSPPAKNQYRPFASLFESRRSKDTDATSPPPLSSVNSEPVLANPKAVESAKPIEVAKPIEHEPVPSPIYNESKTTTKKSEKQLENIEKTAEKTTKEQFTSEPTAESTTRPLPDPSIVRAATEPKSSFLSVKDLKEEPSMNTTPSHEKDPITEAKVISEPVKGSVILPAAVEDTLEEHRPDVVPANKSAIPRPTVEDEPKVVITPAKVTETKIESKAAHDVKPKMQPKNLSPKAHRMQSKPKAGSNVTHMKNIHVKSTPITPKATQQPIQAQPLSQISTSAALKTPSAPVVSTPKASPVPGTTALSILFQPTRTVFVPKTTKAPCTVRAPITAQAPSLATVPKVVRSMLAWAIPEPAPVPATAEAPRRAYLPTAS